MKTLQQFQESATAQGLQLIQINTDGNDYPRGLGAWGVIGFDNFEDAEKFRDEEGGDVVEFETRGGHTFWRNKGNAYTPYTPQDYVNAQNDDVDLTDEENYTSSFWETLGNIIENKDLEKVEHIIGKFKDNLALIQGMEDDETAIYNGNTDEVETCKNEFMQFQYDTRTHAIGVYFNPELNEESEPEDDNQ